MKWYTGHLKYAKIHDIPMNFNNLEISIREVGGGVFCESLGEGRVRLGVLSKVKGM